MAARMFWVQAPALNADSGKFLDVATAELAPRGGVEWSRILRGILSSGFFTTCNPSVAKDISNILKMQRLSACSWRGLAQRGAGCTAVLRHG